MARIALAAGAAIAGYFLAGPWGAVEGASIGLSVGTALFPGKLPGTPPLQDLQVSSSADGAPIPFGYGTMRFAGQIIWSDGIRYRTSRSTTGISTYVYTSSFAAAFGEGPAQINRIWADSKLIYKGGQNFGTVAPWSSTTQYAPEDLVSYRYNPGSGDVTQLFECVLANKNVTPFGNSLYWASSTYAWWDHEVQYFPGNEVVEPGWPSEEPQSANVWTCVTPSKNDRPSESPHYWKPLSAYYPGPSIYPGDESQNPDPLMEAYEGSGTVPAFRGLCYVVWETFPLANFGNRVPNLRAEINFG